MDRGQVEVRLAELRRERDAAVAQAHTLDGAVQATEWVLEQMDEDDADASRGDEGSPGEAPAEEGDES